MPRSESPPPYSQFVDDPFVDNPPAAAPSQPYGVQPASVPTQPYGAQPAQVDYRALHGYGPGIPAPEDIVPPAGKGKWHIVTKGTEIIITRNWALAASRAVGVPGGLYKSQTSWEDALDYYTDCYRNGLIKLIDPSATPSHSTPGQSTSSAVSVNSATSTPTLGGRTMPIHVVSSPSIHVTTSVHFASSPAATPGSSVSHDVQRTPVSGNQHHPIYVSSSPIVAPVFTPAKSAETIKRHRHVEKLFDQMSREKSKAASGPTTPPSEPAAWRDPTPVSIQGARSLSRMASAGPSNVATYVAPSTPTPSPTKTSKGKGKQITNAASDVDYFKDVEPFTDEQLEELFEWEQTLALQAALSSPRFD